VNQQTGKLVTLFMALRNILGAKYESMYGYPMPALTATIGMKFGLQTGNMETQNHDE
jgi:hypothetical protein